MGRFAKDALLVACIWVFVCGHAIGVAAQPSSASAVDPEIFGTVGFGHLANCCRTFGDSPLIGGGAGFHWKRLGVEFDAQRMLGLSPKSIPCLVQYGQTCLSGEQGATSATLASVNALVTLVRRRVEPYVAGGIGVLWSTQVEPDLDRLFAGGPNSPPTAVSLVPREVSDRGFAINFGGGIRVPVTSAIAIRSDVRFYDATLLSAYDMGLARVALQVGYRW